MKDNVSKILASFNERLKNCKDISVEDVVSFLDSIAKELDLLEIYVCENAGAKNHYSYPYVSHGPRFNTMRYNIIVMQDSDIDNFNDVFKGNGICVFGDKISSKRNATAPGNLAYGYLEDGKCVGFVSFQRKEGEEDKPWNDEEKEVITQLGNIFKPLVLERESNDRFAYQKNLENMSVGTFWYYPNLKVIIIPENTMDKFSIDNFVYRDAPESFVKDISNDKFVNEVLKVFTSSSNKGACSSIKFASKKDPNSFYSISLTTNRLGNEDEPLEIMGMIERISQNEESYLKKADLLKRYDKFRETISDNNYAECYVNLISKKLTVFKADNIFRECSSKAKDYDDFIHLLSEKFVSPESKDSFLKTLNSNTLMNLLGKDRRSISLVSNFIIDGSLKRYETVVVMNSTSIYDYTKDVMIFVRDITYTESLNYDRLTGLLTLPHLITKMKEIEGRGEDASSYCLSYFDFVQFKFFNLEYGNSAGDDALKKFANILRETYLDAYISRLADDHFIVLDKEDDEEAMLKANKVIEENSLKNNSLLQTKGGIYHLENFAEPSIYIDYAQLACQSIKRDPRVDCRIYDSELKAASEKKKYVIEHVDEAIEKGWIQLYYQPVINSKDLSLAAMEALSRWIDPNIGFLSPKDFIGALEENNLIYKLDTYVIDQVCKKLRYEIDNNHKVVPISFNLSRNDFLSTRPFEEVEKAIKKYNLPRNLICIEITESVTMEDASLIHKSVDNFQSRGYEVWMDDFGSGYSSLNVLKDFSFDEIKIDMAFLRPLSDKSKIIVSEIITMAKKLGIRTLTEGVESKEHVDFLSSAGCERLQGYYFSKPLPYDELMQNLQKQNIKI